MSNDNWVIGLDFGTDSVRALLVNTENGLEKATAVYHYPRWAKGWYCNPELNQFRQHPQDYIDGLVATIQAIGKEVGPEIMGQVIGLAVDTTGSSPGPVDAKGTPLALLPEFADNPNAMFVLWKDHTAIQEAAEINNLCRANTVDYTKYEGGIYSSEWFWAKIMKVYRDDPMVAQKTYSWVEHCDWVPYLLTGGDDISTMKRSRCAAGHKALWHSDWGGLPPEDFLQKLDYRLAGLRSRLYTETYTSDTQAGQISESWAAKLGLPQSVIVSVGAFDAHMGAVGGQIQPFYLSKVMGTSTCDMLVAPLEELEGQCVQGICGQVDGSIIPGMWGLEAGQSAFGDVYAWFKQILLEPSLAILQSSDKLSVDEKIKLSILLEENTLSHLTAEAEKLSPGEAGVIALDWLNGRRTPDANQALTGLIAGISLGTNAGKLFRALIESTCYGARKIVERFKSEGVPIKGIIGLGGVAKKSPLVMQIMADVLNMPIQIARSEQTCALGAAMFAAVAARAHPHVGDAMEKMGSGFDATYVPDPGRSSIYDNLYAQYLLIGSTWETILSKTSSHAL